MFKGNRPSSHHPLFGLVPGILEAAPGAWSPCLSQRAVTSTPGQGLELRGVACAMRCGRACSTLSGKASPGCLRASRSRRKAACSGLFADGPVKGRRSSRVNCGAGTYPASKEDSTSVPRKDRGWGVVSKSNPHLMMPVPCSYGKTVTSPVNQSQVQVKPTKSHMR